MNTIDSPTALTIITAIAVHSIVSPIPEFPPELYIFPYIIANVIFFSYLLTQYITYAAIFASLMTTNITFILTSTLLTTVRRLFFSPLTKFPGPKLAAISGFWNANEARLGRTPKTHKALHEKYKSDLIRIGPNELSICNADAISKVYRGKYQRGTFNQVFNLPGGNNIATVRDYERHSPWRRIWEKGFTRAELTKYVERVGRHVDKTIRILHEKAGEAVESGKFVDALVYDVITDLAFSKDGGLQTGYGDPTYIDLIHSFMHFVQLVGHLPILQQIFRYLPVNADGRTFNRMGNDMIAKRQALVTDHTDIFTHLLSADPVTGIVFTQEELKLHALLVIVAGADSTSTTLTRIFAVLASQPDIQTRLRREMNDAYDGEGIPPPDILRSLGYLEGVIKEGLRMFAPLLGGVPAVIPKGGITLETGDFIPQNTQVWIGQHVVMSDERNFPRAAEFLPERWIDDENGKANELIKDRRAWIPFGYGTHACPGRGLAMEEMKFIVAKIVREFDIRFGQEGEQPFNYEEWAESWKDFFITEIGKISLKFIPRADMGSIE